MSPFVYIVDTQLEAAACISFFIHNTLCVQRDSLCFVWISLDIGVLFHKTNATQKAAPLCRGPVSCCM